LMGHKGRGWAQLLERQRCDRQGMLWSRGPSADPSKPGLREGPAATGIPHSSHLAHAHTHTHNRTHLQQPVQLIGGVGVGHITIIVIAHLQAGRQAGQQVLKSCCKHTILPWPRGIYARPVTVPGPARQQRLPPISPLRATHQQHCHPWGDVRCLPAVHQPPSQLLQVWGEVRWGGVG